MWSPRAASYDTARSLITVPNGNIATGSACLTALKHRDGVSIVMARKIGDPPTPSGATTVEQLTERLRLLQAWSGMSYRAIHRELVRGRTVRGVPERPVLNTVYRCFQPGRVRLDADDLGCPHVARSRGVRVHHTLQLQLIVSAIRSG